MDSLSLDHEDGLHDRRGDMDCPACADGWWRDYEAYMPERVYVNRYGDN